MSSPARRSPRCRATSSGRSRARRSPTSGASARRAASCAGCASRCSPTARSAAAIGGAFAVMTDIEDDVRIRDALKAQEVAAAPVRRQHSRPDRLPRPLAQVHVRQPGLRELGVQAAGRDLRQDAVRSVLSGDVAAFLRPILKRAQQGEQRRVRAHRQQRAGQAALDARARRARPRCRPARCAGCIAPNTTSTI